MRLAVRQLDNLIDITISSVPESERSNELNRAIGLGVMGFTDVVERLGWSYESEQAYDLIDRVMEFISYHAVDQSADLARERGSYANFDGSGWSRGLVPIDTIDRAERERGVPITVSRSSRLDWDVLRDKVRGGMRNATLMAIAPTASIGLVAGTTPGLDPQFSQLFSRATSSGKFLEVNRNLVADLKERGLWEQVRDDLLRAQGDVSALDAVPADLKRSTRRRSSCRRTRSSRWRPGHRSGSTRRSAATCTSRPATWTTTSTSTPRPGPRASRPPTTCTSSRGTRPSRAPSG